jgi:hypothetical protein
MPNNLIEVEIDTHGTERELFNASGKISSEFDKFKTDILNIALKVVQKEAPVGKTKQLASAVKKDDHGVFVSKNIAHHRDWVMDGRGGFCAKNAKALRFQIYGKVIFRKCVGPAKAQPFVDTAFPEVERQINIRTREFESFLEAL